MTTVSRRKGAKCHPRRLREAAGGVEEEPALWVELAGEDEAHDLHRATWTEIGVLEDGHGETEREEAGAFGQCAALPFFVKETVAELAHSGEPHWVPWF